MLLLYWRHQVQDEVERASQLSPEGWALVELGAALVLPKRLEDLERQAGRASELSSEDWRLIEQGAELLPEERLAALEEQAGLVEDPARRELVETAAALEPDELRKLTDLARDPEAVAAAATLSEGAVLVPVERLAALEEQAGMVEDPARRELAETAAALEPDELRRLTDLADDPEAVAAAAALSEGAILVPVGRLAALEEYERLADENADEIVEALNLRRVLDPDGEDSNGELVTRVEDLLATERTVDSRLAAVKDRLAEDAAARGNSSTI